MLYARSIESNVGLGVQPGLPSRGLRPDAEDELHKEYQPLKLETWKSNRFTRTGAQNGASPPHLHRYCAWKTRSASTCASVSQLAQPSRSISTSILSLNWSYLVRDYEVSTMIQHESRLKKVRFIMTYHLVWAIIVKMVQTERYGRRLSLTDIPRE